MNRRNFLSLFSAGVAGIALEQAIPLGRVWSFPKEIVIAEPANEFLETSHITENALRILKSNLTYLTQFDYSYAEIRANGWRFPTAAFPPDSSHTPS